ncbi:hypothetical protein KC19_11G098800 [Ceratodon purpureus]|uniref:Uncharacterized protein n=1 Tax=Ceratodon purpureus TaxID=3225 RepID=A0A8T0GEU8_CERPU|nr:hypothetical protein KC19_11G098800 [Ceratodon purpureus]
MTLMWSLVTSKPALCISVLGMQPQCFRGRSTKFLYNRFECFRLNFCSSHSWNILCRVLSG